jgi:serine phosphatase RsbU (regulator of sigma subunit)/anti-sigma regulatory factor (Ser/Thr protein kinase)
LADGHVVNKTSEDDHELVARARAHVRDLVDALGLHELAEDAELVISELATNAVLHGGGCLRAAGVPILDGIRIEVEDRRGAPPVSGLAPSEGMTGRGIRLVSGLASRWGFEATAEGKVVWAEITTRRHNEHRVDHDEALAAWHTAIRKKHEGRTRFHVVLGDVPTELLVAAKAHVDNLIREFALAAGGARSGMTAEVVPHMKALIDTVAFRFADAREAIKHQALTAARAGRDHTRLELDLGPDAADAAEEYLEALDALDAYCRAARLLTLETPPQHRLFRRWYVTELIGQVRALARGEIPDPPQTFEARTLQEIDRMGLAQRISEQSARLYAVAGALTASATPESVAEAVLAQAVAALGASGGGMLRRSEDDGLLLSGTVGYGSDVVAKLRSESADAELPAAQVLRTGIPVWIESRSERDERFPDLVALEPATVSMCAVPLEVQGRRLGALRFSFNEPRLFDEDERRFVMTLGAQAAQALDRSQLQEQQIDNSRRLQRSLLPPLMPTIPGVDVAAIYQPFGDGMEVGGDFYDVWQMPDGLYGFAIGDVAGTGPEAAAQTALVRYSLRALTFDRKSVADALEALNDLLRAANPQSDEIFVTAIFGSLTPSDGGAEVELASGGHPFPFVRRVNGDVEEIALGGSLLGALPAIDITISRITLGVGDTLVLFTDGVIEARPGGGEMFERDGIGKILDGGVTGAAALVESLQAAVVAHVGGDLVDDMAAMAIRITER